MPEQKFKRNIAYKYRVNDILNGKPIFEEGKFRGVEIAGGRVMRVNVVGNIIDRYDSSGDKNYVFFTLDDGSNQISLKAFGEDADKLKDITQGLTVVVIGVLRSFNNQVYISPEIIKEKDPKYLLVRKLELEKDKSKNLPKTEKKQTGAIREKLLEKIKTSEEAGGIETDKIITDERFQDTSPETIKEEKNFLKKE